MKKKIIVSETQYVDKAIEIDFPLYYKDEYYDGPHGCGQRYLYSKSPESAINIYMFDEVIEVSIGPLKLDEDILDTIEDNDLCSEEDFMYGYSLAQDFVNNLIKHERESLTTTLKALKDKYPYIKNIVNKHGLRQSPEMFSDIIAFLQGHILKIEKQLETQINVPEVKIKGCPLCGFPASLSRAVTSIINCSNNECIRSQEVTEGECTCCTRPVNRTEGELIEKWNERAY